jgi:aspartate/methionine/tyrosine aminotransferase
LCRQWHIIAISDEVYEYIIFDGTEHIRLAQLPAWPIAKLPGGHKLI